MDYTSNLEKYSYKELKNMAERMEIPIRRSKEGIISEINLSFKEYYKYKKDKLQKYSRGVQLGKNGKEGITYLVTDKKGNEFAMKTFKKSKSSKTLQKEAKLQKTASDHGIAPNVIDIDTVSKYIVMDKMDKHLFEVLKERHLSATIQKDIINIYKKLDKAGVFHGDVNIANFMYKDDKLCIIDFGMAKEITKNLVDNLGNTPNLTVMTLGLILKLKELNFDNYSYKYLKKYISQEQCIKFNIE